MQEFSFRIFVGVFQASRTSRDSQRQGCALPRLPSVFDIPRTRFHHGSGAGDGDGGAFSQCLPSGPHGSGVLQAGTFFAVIRSTLAEIHGTTISPRTGSTYCQRVQYPSSKCLQSLQSFSPEDVEPVARVSAGRPSFVRGVLVEFMVEIFSRQSRCSSCWKNSVRRFWWRLSTTTGARRPPKFRQHEKRARLVGR